MSTQSWRKSSRSSAQNTCVELCVAAVRTDVRDSKRPEAGTLSFTATTFGEFLANVKAGRHDLS